MAALVRHDTITSRRAIRWTGVVDCAFRKAHPSAIEMPLPIAPDAGEVARFHHPVGRKVEPERVETSFPASAYVLHLPGRFWLQNGEFSQNPSLLEATRGELSALRGVSSVFTNSLTGGILVEYDPVVFPPAALSEALQKRGFLCIDLTAVALDTATQKSPTEPFVRTGLRTLLEALVQQILVVVIAAVI